MQTLRRVKKHVSGRRETTLSEQPQSNTTHKCFASFFGNEAPLLQLGCGGLSAVSLSNQCASESRAFVRLSGFWPGRDPPSPPRFSSTLPLGPAGPTLTELSQIFRSTLLRTYQTTAQFLHYIYKYTHQRDAATPKKWVLLLILKKL